jgi:hypothetical protein
MLLLVVWTGCKKKDTAPTVYLPHSVGAVSTDDTIAFEFTATDDQELAEIGYFITTGIDTIPGILPSWQVITSTAIAGNTAFMGDTLPVPDSISAGNYRFGVFAVDAMGFRDSLVDDFIITSKLDSLMPRLDTIVAPDTLTIGDELSLSFSLSDDTRLVFASYMLSSLVNDSTLVQRESPVSGLSFADSLKLPDIGDFQRVRFEVNFYDWVNNKTRESTDIIIKD